MKEVTEQGSRDWTIYSTPSLPSRKDMSSTLSEQPSKSLVTSGEFDVASNSQLTTLKVMWVLFSLATGGLFMGMNEADPDLWGHSLYGRDWIETGHLAKTTTGSFTSIGFRWINHENLAELLTAGIELQFGPLGLVIGKFLLSQVVLGLIFWQARRQGVSWGIAGLFVILASLGLAFHWHFRPQILGYTLFSLMLVTLSWIFQGWEGRWNLRPWRFAPLPLDEGVEYRWQRMRCLWFSFGLFAVWTNTHGSFAAGLAVFVAYLVFRSFEAVCLWGWSAEGRIRRFVMMSGLAALGTYATPYGFELHRWMLAAIGHPQPEIQDWQPIPLFTSEALPFWVLTAVSLIALRRSRLPKDFTQLMILVLVGWQAVSHMRHLTFLALLIAFWIPPHCQSAWSRITERADGLPQDPPRRVLVQWTSIVLFLGIVSMGVRLAPRLSRLEVDASQYPVAAMQFMEDHQLRGRTVVTFNWAQYALACFEQESDPLRRSTVAYDGRYTTCYSPEVIDIYFDFLFGKNFTGERYRSPQSGPVDPEKALRYASPELFVLNRQQQGTVRILEAHRDQWTLLYQDSLAQVWGLKKRFDTVGEVDYLPPEVRQISETGSIDRLAYPALPVLRVSMEPLAVD